MDCFLITRSQIVAGGHRRDVDSNQEQKPR